MEEMQNFELRRQLGDAGCDEETIGRYCALDAADCASSDRRQKQRCLLRSHRRALLAQLHLCQRRLDCLDYLLYRLRCEEEE